MEIGSFRQQTSGYKAFIPNKFPPSGGLQFSKTLDLKHSQAVRLLGKLDGITQLLPDVDFFLMMFMRKDAASSSQIEGTQATMVDAIEAEARTSRNIPADVDDVRQYLKALKFGLDRLRELPLSLRFIRELHKQLMEEARTTHFADPGEFRKTQNWIGGTSPANARFVPPPPHEMLNALSDLEAYLHEGNDVPPLVRAGLIHAQFESIHPFLDGNGRTGRLLITMYLWLNELLEKPVLFLSSYFKRYQSVYYERLYGYHHGRVEEWLDFFLDGVAEIASESIDICRKITALREQDMSTIQKLSKSASESGIIVLRKLFGLPIINVNTIVEWTGFTRQGAQGVIDRFVELDILRQKDETERYGRSFVYRRYLNAFLDNES